MTLHLLLEFHVQLCKFISWQKGWSLSTYHQTQVILKNKPNPRVSQKPNSRKLQFDSYCQRGLRSNKFEKWGLPSSIFPLFEIHNGQQHSKCPERSFSVDVILFWGIPLVEQIWGLSLLFYLQAEINLKLYTFSKSEVYLLVYLFY